MKGKAVPLVVYEVGEELGTREEATVDVAAAVPGPGRGDRRPCARRSSDALAGAGGVVTVDGATGMGKSRLVARGPRARSTGAHVLVRPRPSRTARPAPTACSATRSARCSAIERDTPEAMGAGPARHPVAVAPDLLPMAPLLADVVQVDVPSTPEVDRLDPQFRPDRLADAVVDVFGRRAAGAARARRRGGALG